MKIKPKVKCSKTSVKRTRVPSEIPAFISHWKAVCCSFSIWTAPQTPAASITASFLIYLHKNNYSFVFFFLHTYRIFFFRSVHGRLCSQGSSICISSLFLIEQQEETRRNATCQKLSSKVDFCVCVHGCADLWGSYVTVISDKKIKKKTPCSHTKTAN